MTPPQLDFSTVIASAIHDMKNSLGALIGGLEDLQQHVQADDQKSIDGLRHQSQRLNNQLMQMLSIYKLQRGIATANLDWHGVDELLQEAAEAHAPLLSSRGIEISVDPALSQSSLMVCCDRELVLNVLDNALTNAFRYVKSQIELSADSWRHDKGEGVVLRVRDDGPGFPEDFDATAAPGANTDDVHEAHTGLGLYFCRLVASLHRNQGIVGHISCDNAGIAGGARLSLFLP